MRLELGLNSRSSVVAHLVLRKVLRPKGQEPAHDIDASQHNLHGAVDFSIRRQGGQKFKQRQHDMRNKDYGALHLQVGNSAAFGAFRRDQAAVCASRISPETQSSTHSAALHR